ncbi:hypothetical protein Mnod_3246 [Methylobacterium nodulans ORS 2060]|uniref:Uncharacterized protein n=1 Tax=Methylobacterium nodulans (strain LMG 21967 / CNCM I-2342 / ORS 2060) TaxID=460265 RepID=B8IKY2_METNO|nr:hypothetical protein Mnod_3246 [Methylobacterium nodulans ORS 2060]
MHWLTHLGVENDAVQVYAHLIVLYESWSKPTRPRRVMAYAEPELVDGPLYSADIS